jgi:hypothetical protein
VKARRVPNGFGLCLARNRRSAKRASEPRPSGVHPEEGAVERRCEANRWCRSEQEGRFSYQVFDYLHRAIRSNIASSVDLLVHMARARGKRAVTEVLEMASYSADGDEYRFRSEIRGAATRPDYVQLPAILEVASG